MMKMIQLGATDLQVSAIAFGCMSLTRERETAGKAAVWRAFELGINFFDTADVYHFALLQRTIIRNDVRFCLLTTGNLYAILWVDLLNIRYRKDSVCASG